MEECNRGHDVTNPEIGRIYSRGAGRFYRRCLLCQREYRRSRYKSDPKVRERQRIYANRWRRKASK